MSANTQDAILLFGDSITQKSWDPQGLATTLANAYVRKLDVINRGLSGYNTRWAIPVFDQIFAKAADRANTPEIRLMTIWFGANDAALPVSVQHVPIDEYGMNLCTLIDKVISPQSAWYSPETKIILINPPPLGYNQWKEHTEGDEKMNREHDVTRSYAERAVEIGKEKGIAVADVYSAIWDAAGQKESGLEKYLLDGLHLNSEGYKIVSNVVMQVINDHYPEYHSDKLQPVFVPWDQINEKNYKEIVLKRDIF